MSCDKYQNLIVPYAEGDLPPELMEEMAEHINKCDKCSKELDTVIEMMGILKETEYPQMEPDSGMRNRVLAEIAGDKPIRKPLWYTKLPGISAAAAVLLFTVFGIMMFYTNDSQDPNIERAIQSSATMPKESAIEAKIHDENQPDSEKDKMAAKSAIPNGEIEQEIAAAVKYPGAPSLKKPKTTTQPLKSAAIDKKAPSETIVRDDTVQTSSKSHIDSSIQNDDEAIVSYSYSSKGPGGGSSKALTKKSPSPKRFVQSYSYSAQDPHPNASMAAPRSADIESAIMDGSSGFGKGTAGEIEKSLESQSTPGSPSSYESHEMSSKSASSRVIDDKTAALTVEKDDMSSISIQILDNERKLKKSPNNTAIMEELMMLYNKAGRTADAYMMADKLVKHDPNNASYLFSKAELAEKMHLSNIALRCYESAVSKGLSGINLETAKARIAVLKSKPE